MSSKIDVMVVSEDGEEISHVQFTVEYGNERQDVLVVLGEVDDEPLIDRSAPETPSIGAFRDINDMMVEHGIINCQSNTYDA